MKKRATLCYVPPIPRAALFMQHIRQFETTHPLIFFGDSEWAQVKTPGPVPGLTYKENYNPTSSLGSQMFIKMLELAIADGLTEFICLEDDCFVTQHHWDSYIYAAYDKWPRAVCGGSPVITNPLYSGDGWEKDIIRYCYNYQHEADVAVALEGCEPWEYHKYRGLPIVFPNGAFAVYNVAYLKDVFELALKDSIAYRDTINPYDQRVGFHLSATFQRDVFNRVAAIPCVYSGCGDRHVSKQQRIAMTATKVGIHKWDFA